MPLPPKKKPISPYYTPPKKGHGQGYKHNSKKPSRKDRGRKPARGERKAMRKRIILSNTNALEVQLSEFNVEDIQHERCIDEIMAIPNPLIDRLRHVGAFKATQGWGLFRHPSMLVRKETVEMAKLVQEINEEKENTSRVVRRVLVGDKGSGKSVMLLQTMSIALLKGWTVINIPEAQDLTLGHTPYAPLVSPTSNERTLYTQPAATASLLTAISRSNPHLTTLHVSSQTVSDPFPTPLKPDLSLAGLAQLGVQDPELAWPIFTTLITELLAPGRPPVLFSLDGLAHAMQPATGYTAPDLKPIHPHDLTLLDWFCSFLSGSGPRLPNGGIIMASTSQSNAPQIPTLDVALSGLEGGYVTPAGQTVPPLERNPFKRYDERVFDVFGKAKENGAQVQRVRGLTKEEARALMEYWARSGMVRHKVNDAFLGEKWALSGGGVVGELERATLRMRI
ncbi:MAG: hypothetical protein LQ351_006220 [Letrouitia transgressa]|nr:MAG: hypothetical protein LQ351_006220 [Letrouitia transgressa]